MNIFQKLFKAAPQSQNKTGNAEYLRMTQEKTDKVWKYLEETVDFYNETACPCAFQRFRQIVSIDCVDFRKSFYASETEGFISAAYKHFTVEPIPEGNEANNAIWTCNTCSSTYLFGWSDFSIHVNRTFLKVADLKTKDIGAPPVTPIPLHVGLFGHTFPDHSHILPTDFDTFASYIRAMEGS
ncbi:hypothetical protein [Dyadobacter sp. CY323]|uniref:hypothetical protein n=1 Tax=Dyadobacter sp. CY323 TaxID=2907302 RepID=UPI001F35B472|nr:hypothetical protein [Dyadobacter sp. CY323]MCE6990115.1 hypothetical protein [Dyadobacter sp. CY323]